MPKAPHRGGNGHPSVQITDNNAPGCGREKEPIRLLLLNIHGLIRGDELEIGRDADNGGQTRYVRDVADYLARNPKVTHVHLFTRLIDDDSTDEIYSVPVEYVAEKLTIHRIPFAGKRYRMKEELWAHLDEFVAGALQHIRERDIMPDWIHSHYADAGYAAAELSRLLKIPFAHTGHSLGRRKQEKLPSMGLSREQGEQRFKFSKRIAAEEDTLSQSEFVVTSTEQEMDTYRDYEHFGNANFEVLAPGIDTAKFAPYYQAKLAEEPDEEELQRRYWVGRDIERFLSNPQKPVILALSRPDRRKNLSTLLDVYGQHPQLQSLANLVIYAGIRKDIESMPKGEREVLVDMLLKMDKYDLYGKMAIPKKHDVENEVATIYRYCAEKRGVFVNVALHENFGLTTIEAASAGLPVVVTKFGGPSEIIPRCKNGVLVDPEDAGEIEAAIESILTDEDRWRDFSDAGILNVQRHYSWESHARRYVDLVETYLSETGGADAGGHPSDNLRHMRRLLVSDIDGTLILESEGNPGLERIREFLANRPREIGYGLASGRSAELVREAIDQFDLPEPDFMVCAVGSQIFYQDGGGYIQDKAWSRHLDRNWDREALVRSLKAVPWLEMQGPEGQNPHKVSYNVNPDQWDPERLRLILGKAWRNVSLIYSHNAYLDILPRRASKGRALRYLSRKWAIPTDDVIVAGDSGNDRDMLLGSMRGVAVGNRGEELDGLKGGRNLYLAEKPAAEGIYEGLEHYGWV